MTFSPMTWQAGPGTGSVDFVSGIVDITSTYVTSGGLSTLSVSCDPPGGIGALDQTSVVAPPPTPAISLPASTPPVESQVTAGGDAGWSFQVSNPSGATVYGVIATLSTADGQSLSPSFDMATMDASQSTRCTSPSVGTATCKVGTLLAGDEVTLNPLVDSTGLQNGSQVSATISVSASNASTQSGTLESVDVVVEPGQLQTVTAPNTTTGNTSASNVSDSVPVIVSLKFPKEKFKKKQKDRASRHRLNHTPRFGTNAGSAVKSSATGSAIGVSLGYETVSSGSGSQMKYNDAALCWGSAPCYGDLAIAQFTANVPGTTKAPIESSLTVQVGQSLTNPQLWIDEQHTNGVPAPFVWPRPDAWCNDDHHINL